MSPTTNSQGADRGGAVYRGFGVTARLLLAAKRWDLRVDGVEHVPAFGPAVIAPNHVSYLDPMVVGLGLRTRGRWPRYLGKAELFARPVFGPLLRTMRHVPVEREISAAAALDAARRRLAEGDVVVVFPEGTISTDFRPMEGRTGAARLAVRTGAPLVPAALWGAHRLATKGRPRDLRRGVTLACRFGPAIAAPSDEDPAAVHRRLMAAITGLVEDAAAAYPQRPTTPDDAMVAAAAREPLTDLRVAHEQTTPPAALAGSVERLLVGA